jgi:hypothetical protein
MRCARSGCLRKGCHHSRAGDPSVCAIAGDSDGVDGAEDSAGALVVPEIDTLARISGCSGTRRRCSRATTFTRAGKIIVVGFGSGEIPRRFKFLKSPHLEFTGAPNTDETWLHDEAVTSAIGLRLTALLLDFHET